MEAGLPNVRNTEYDPGGERTMEQPAKMVTGLTSAIAAGGMTRLVR
jgi:hypothetical protein